MVICYEQEAQNTDDVLFMSPTNEGTVTLSSEFHDAHEVEQVKNRPSGAGPLLCRTYVYPNTEASGILSLC